MVAGRREGVREWLHLLNKADYEAGTKIAEAGTWVGGGGENIAGAVGGRYLAAGTGTG